MSAAKWAKEQFWWELIKPTLDAGLTVFIHVPAPLPAHTIREDRRMRGQKVAVIRSTTITIPVTEPFREVAGCVFISQCGGGGFHWDVITPACCIDVYGPDPDAVVAALTEAKPERHNGGVPPLPFQTAHAPSDDWN